MEKIGIIRFLENHAWKMQQCFRLTHWRITISSEDKIKDKKAWYLENFKHNSMVTIVNQSYLLAEIVVLKDAFDEYKQDIRYGLLENLCHEITHIFTNACWNQSEKYRQPLERSTEHISRLLLENYDSYMKKYKINYKTGLISNKK